MTRIQILLVVLLVACVAAIGCYWFWASRTPQVALEEETSLALEEAQQQSRTEDEQGEDPVQRENAGEKLQRDGPGNQNGGGAKIQTAQEAIKVAKKLLGWEKEGKYTAEKTIINNCFVPFVRKEVNGKVGWRIRLTGLTLKLKARKPEEEYPYPIKLEAENPFVKEFHCIILADTGQLVQIESRVPNGVVVKPDRVPVEQAENAYSAEHIAGLPNEPSELSFRRVLNRAFEEEGCWVSEAQQIIAYYAVRSYGQNQEIRSPQPLWSIYVRGSRPSPVDGPGLLGPGQEAIDPGTINHMRFMFTKDGKGFGADGKLAPK